MRGIIGPGAAAAIAVFVASWAGPAHADQVVVFDVTWDHTPDLPDSHFRLPPMEGTPADWVNPTDYSQGSAWVYLEVHTKPTDQETKFQVCFEATPTYACTAQSPTYTEVGVYEWETPFSGFWSPPGESVDWTQGVNQIACILKDTENGKPSADNVGPEIAALYTPTEVRLVVTLVEPGSIYEPPTPTGAGGDTGAGDGATDSGAADGSTGGAPAGSSSDGGGGTAAETGMPPGASGDGTAASSDGSTGASSAAGDGDSDDGGCACASSSRGGAGSAWWLLVPMVFGGWRRPRTSGASASRVAGMRRG